MFLATKRGRWGVAAVVLAAAVVSSLTRSGYVILGGGLVGSAAVVAAGAILRGRFAWRADSIIASLGAGVVVVAAAHWVTGSSVLMERLGGVFDPGAAGNAERLEAWRKGVELWAGGPVLLGESVGLATQATRKLYPDIEWVNVESGLVQQLVNYGVVGTVAFYTLLLAVVAAVKKEHVLMRMGLLAAVVQSIGYMSIETVPYMFLVGVAPAISRRLGGEGETRRRGRG
jgi:hypothetical protein